jgi:hypothetical protein
MTGTAWQRYPWILHLVVCGLHQQPFRTLSPCAKLGSAQSQEKRHTSHVDGSPRRTGIKRGFLEEDDIYECSDRVLAPPSAKIRIF